MCDGSGLIRLFPSSWVERATRPYRRATGPAEDQKRLLPNALHPESTPSLSIPVGESPTGTGGSPVPPDHNGAGYKICGLILFLIQLRPLMEVEHV
jgi:hypothetical protein